MRRNIVHIGADELVYEIRNIVALARQLESTGVEITWENIGDPVQKGEIVAPWIKKIVTDIITRNGSWGYTATQGEESTRKFLASKVNERGGVQITPNDIVFFNGLGDAVAKIFGFLRREARILGPSPAYSTFSSAEAAHSGYEHLTYELNPYNNWMPNLEEIENKIKYNDSITGIILINPDNPTGAVFPKEIIREISNLCEKYDCFLVCDETYAHVSYENSGFYHLSEIISDNVCAMALRSISKEVPWPGARCGWIEVFNKKNDQVFARYIKSLVDAKMLEVCSTTLPQLAIPEIYSSPEFIPHLKKRNQKLHDRAKKAVSYLKDIEGVQVVEPKGAFYLTVMFKPGTLKNTMQLDIPNQAAKNIITPLLKNTPNDRRFVLHMLASKGICVVPLSSFCCDKEGFRVTLLEENTEKFEWIYQTIKDSIQGYLQSA
ncbi:MAG: pyridoxal phosphate-dependent aminotransferase [Leptospiraceae bacterium]|nr:pyridoxal phosphate-dependent aminotransferase [Leptospiraceae bacterium]MCP5493785.1 pyridoxal phosphate-dependent aminotransferase [Leptospiraceae bacterium]